ncbi:PRC-barrel domain-containing protein [Streptomyces sp. NPDC058867]|uniref:PRC-barrel domain-containing protein n=1 Tax=unclassified Streptomyces TaxID=2593676 RepID=UPI003685D556
MSDSMWGYNATSGHTTGADLIGYKVEATDGSIGKVDKHSDEVGSAYLVVDTGVWIFGKHVLLPAGTVKSVDSAERKIYVELTKEQIKDSPEFDKDKHVGDPAYHEQVGSYYQSHRRI